MLCIQKVRPLYILLNYFRAHGLLERSREDVAQMLEAEDTDASGCEARFADPDVFLSIDSTVLGVLPLEVFVELVCLIHDVEIWNLPTSEGCQLMDGLPTYGVFLELSDLVLINRYVESAVFGHKIQNPLRETESRLVVVFLNEFITLALLLQEQQIPAVKCGIPQ